MTLLSVAWLVLLTVVTDCRLRVPPSLGQYYINWQGGFTACEGANNSMFDLTSLIMEKRNKTVLALAGNVTLSRDVDKLAFKLSIFKDVNSNWEYFTALEEKELCQHIMEKNRAWTPFITEMGISGCPIPAKTYSFKDSTLDTAGFPLNALHAGSYRGTVELFQDGVKQLCVHSQSLVSS